MALPVQRDYSRQAYGLRGVLCVIYVMATRLLYRNMAIGGACAFTVATGLKTTCEMNVWGWSVIT